MNVVFYLRPFHPYICFLLDPWLCGKETRILKDEPPIPVDPLSSCRFCARCPCAAKQRAAREAFLHGSLPFCPAAHRLKQMEKQFVKQLQPV